MTNSGPKATSALDELKDLFGCELTFEQRDGYLFAQAVGPRDDLTIARRMWHEIAVELKRTGKKKLLVLEGLRQPMTLLDVYHLVCEFAHTIIHDVPVAFVDLLDADWDVNEFAITAAKNRGYTIKLFRSESDGEDWLRRR